VVAISGALSVVISSGSTLGHENGNDDFIYVYLINNAGTAELAVSTKKFDEGSIVTTVAEGGAGAADDSATMYSTTVRAGVGFRLIGRLKSNQAVAGTWALVPVENSILPFSQENRIESPFAGLLRVTSARITYPAGVPTVADEAGSWIDSLTDNGSGNTTINITAGIFKNAPFVIATVESGSNRKVQLQNAPTASAITTFSTDLAGSGTDDIYHIYCIAKE